MLKPHNDQEGFTLIEVLIAVVIMAIGILSVISMQLTAIKGNLTAGNISVASGWAADQIEKIFAKPYNDDDLRDDESISNASNNPDGATGLDDATPGTADGMTTSPNGLATIYWNVADDLIMPNTKTIRIIVQRKDFGVTKTVTMNYLKAKYM